mmetsp:Transcript_15210/g.25748  ORF Transcript_15210/g.25748 Transcript_15210/m.25748 type:complete len:290 (-) Transcript_15210:395-1264(-)
MEMLGPSLYSLFEFCDFKFSLKTILWIGSQMMLRIESFHQMNFVHRDIKPENFLIGQGKKVNQVYLIDFGLSKRYKCPKSGQHIEYKMKNGITGTPRYCSLSAHNMFEQSRRDDLEAIGLILIFFLNEGYLPWMEAEDLSRKKQLEIKERVSIEELCKGYPHCFLQYMKYCRSLKFEQKPDYKYLKQLFDDCFFIEHKYEMDNVFDWQYQKEKILAEKRKNEEEEKERQLRKQKGKLKPPNKRQEQLAAQKALFEQQEEERKKLKEEKKKKKIEKMEEEKVSKNSKEYM